MSTTTADAGDLLERLCNLLRRDVRALGAGDGLQPVHLETLRFLTQCNRYSDTPRAVTEFLGLTKGTVSQTLKLLEQKGLLRKHGDAADRRIVHLKPTPRGRRVVAGVPEGLRRGLEAMSAADAAALADSLRRLLRAVQQANGFQTFGACHTCRFNQRDAVGEAWCGLTHEPLTDQDIRLLCREHQYPPVTGAQ